MAVNRAITQLTQWLTQWQCSVKEGYTIVHKNFYLERDAWASEISTEICWNGLRWNSDNSQTYFDLSAQREGIEDGNQKTFHAKLPVGCTVTYPGDEPEDRGLSFAELRNFLKLGAGELNNNP
jgi:hypothetical protein